MGFHLIGVEDAGVFRLAPTRGSAWHPIDVAVTFVGFVIAKDPGAGTIQGKGAKGFILVRGESSHQFRPAQSRAQYLCPPDVFLVFVGWAQRGEIEILPRGVRNCSVVGIAAVQIIRQGAQGDAFEDLRLAADDALIGLDLRQILFVSGSGVEFKALAGAGGVRDGYVEPAKPILILGHLAGSGAVGGQELLDGVGIVAPLVIFQAVLSIAGALLSDLGEAESRPDQQ